MSEPHAAEPGESSSARNLVQALVAPREAFTALARQPTTALALVVLVFLGVIAIHVAMSRVPPESLFASLEEQGQQLPPDAKENPERFLKIALWSQTAAAVVFGPALYLALAGVFLVLFRMLGSELAFRQSLATTLHGMLPFGVAAVVGVVVSFGRDEISLEELQYGGLVASHLGFLAGEDASKVVRALLTSIDLFSIWCIALLAIGYRIVARVSAGAAWAAVVAVWAVGIALKLALAAAF
jgi:hypothetical protein